MPSSVPVIGLVGGIGSGKSTVASMLRELGCLVSNSDDLARAALREPAIKREIVLWWGGDVLDPESGEIDRKKVAAIVFADTKQRKQLEGLTHPWIESQRRAAFAQAPKDTRALVIDAPLLLEAGLDRECDAIVFVDAPASTRLERVQTTRGWDEVHLKARESAQMGLDAKRLRADHIVVNDGDLDTLRTAVARMLDQVAGLGTASRARTNEPRDRRHL